jgi:hypothetical protein
LGVALSGSVAHGDSIASAILNELGAGPQVLAFDDDTRVQLARDVGQIGILDAGDRFRAQLVFRNINQVIGNETVTLGGVGVQPASPVNELTGYVEIEVTGKSGSAATGYTFTFGAWSSEGTITDLANDPGAILALYEDASQNGMLSSLPIPDETMVDGDLWAVLSLSGPGQTTLNLQTDAQPNGLHNDANSAAGVPPNETLGQGNLRLNRVDLGGAALTDDANNLYEFGPNSFGTDFAGTFDYFGGGGTGADFTAAMELRSTVTIIPLPPAFLAAMPGLALMAFVSYRRRRLA